jgi:hypothetical protein
LNESRTPEQKKNRRSFQQQEEGGTKSIYKKNLIMKTSWKWVLLQGRRIAAAQEDT